MPFKPPPRRAQKRLNWRPMTVSEQPTTMTSLAQDLKLLGVQPGQVLLVHCAFSSLGSVYGGPQALIDALQASLSPGGTLVMPTHSTQLTEPSKWQQPPAPKAWWQTIRDELPAFDTERTPTRQMGVVAELFRSYPDVLRSAHPHGSFAAWGPQAASITQNHPHDCIFGERSPLARLYERNAKVLLIGVGHSNNTSLHLAEYRCDLPSKRYHTEGAPMWVDGVVGGTKQWVEFEELVIDSDDFGSLGEDFARQTNAETQGRIAAATATFFSQPAIVDFAVDWMNKHRGN